MKYNILKQLLPYSFISFDVFDTLLYRTFPHYTDVFDIMEALYNESNFGEKLTGFKRERINAERIARRKKVGKEVTLDLIYDNLVYEGCLKEKLKEIEKKVEIENCVPNQVMIDVLNECRAQGKRIVITTDMYLPRDVIDKILKKIGVEYDYLFISGEEGVTKHSGELFPIVLQKLGIKASDMIHIGDDMNNDIAQPKRFGIAALQRIQNEPVSVPYSNNKDNKSIEEKHIDEILKRGIQRYGNGSDVILGYSILGPFLWEFCEWIHKMKEDLHFERLLFVAREGWLIMKCYMEMYPDDKDFVRYIRLNKNLLRLPSLKNGDRVKKFIRSIPERNNLLWRDILKYLGVNNTDNFIADLKHKYPDNVFDNSVNRKDLYEDKNIKKILEYAISKQHEVINDQYEMLLEYLKANDLTSTVKIGLVNNSINGSGQSLVEEFLADNGLSCNIFGLQFIRSQKCIELLHNRSAGWVNNHIKANFGAQ